MEIHFLNTAAVRTDNAIHQKNEAVLSLVVHYGLQEQFSISISVICVFVLFI